MKTLKNKKSILPLAMFLLLTFCPLLSSCGPTVRVKITGTKDGVTVNTSQSAHDSTGLNIQVNPNISLK